MGNPTVSCVSIHPQLFADCHHIGALQVCEVLLNRNASVPWFILVPHTELEDVLDLPTQLGAKVLAECAAISAFIKGDLHFPKVNFAGLGNVVPQMHLHIIGRSKADACWPQPVWGVLPDSDGYDLVVLQRWQSSLEAQLGLTAVSLE
jgi:diadenosine tetraphosphate (Ap4A) HIT family hydrolase